MAHFARLDGADNVVGIYLVSNEEITSESTEHEVLGQKFLQQIHKTGDRFKQCSYNSSFRENYPAVGYQYDSNRNAFIGSQPFSSWVLNEETVKWEPPVAMPTDGKMYSWDEESESWKEMTAS